MLLAGMLRANETALVCDLAETYHIYDYRSVPLRTLAMLAAGLRDDSRIMMYLQDRKIYTRDMLLAAAVDRLSVLVWGNTKDGQKNRNRPESILKLMTEDHTDYQGFENAEDLLEARRRIMEGS